MLMRARDDLDAHMRRAGFANARVRGPWVLGQGPLCFCNASSRAAPLGAEVYGTGAGGASVAAADVAVQLHAETAGGVPANEEVQLRASIGRVDCCPVDFTVRLRWRCLVAYQDVLPALRQEGDAEVSEGPALTLTTRPAWPGVDVVLEVWLMGPHAWAQPITVQRHIVILPPPAALVVQVSPAQGVAWHTRFALSFAPCGAAAHTYFYVLDGRTRVMTDTVACAVPPTMLPAGATHVGACAGEAGADARVCSTAGVSVLDRTFSTAEMGAQIAQLNGRSLKAMAWKASALVPGLVGVLSAHQRHKLTGALLGRVETALGQEAVDHQSGQVPTPRAVEASRVPARCRHVLVHSNVMQFEFDTLHYGGDGSAEVQGIRAQIALAFRLKPEWVALCEATDGPSPAAPPGTPPQCDVSAGDGPHRAARAGPRAAPDATTVVGYLGNCCALEPEEVTERLLVLLRTYLTPTLQAITPPLRVLSDASGCPQTVGFLRELVRQPPLSAALAERLLQRTLPSVAHPLCAHEAGDTDSAHDLVAAVLEHVLNVTAADAGDRDAALARESALYGNALDIIAGLAAASTADADEDDDAWAGASFTGPPALTTRVYRRPADALAEEVFSSSETEFWFAVGVEELVLRGGYAEALVVAVEVVPVVEAARAGEEAGAAAHPHGSLDAEVGAVSNVLSIELLARKTQAEAWQRVDIADTPGAVTMQFYVNNTVRDAGGEVTATECQVCAHGTSAEL